VISPVRSRRRRQTAQRRSADGRHEAEPPTGRPCPLGAQGIQEDEPYYVLRGKAKMDSDGKRVDLQPGSLVFIASDAPHKFIDIEEDLGLLVVFSSGPLQKHPKQKQPKK
jgi:hypothetical protein